MLAEVSASVEQTIGVEYEIISLDNSTGLYSICQAYNIGAQQSKFDVLCFMHEDLVFHTNNWGQVVISTLQDHSIGLLGIIGGVYKTKTYSGWWSIPKDLKRMRVLQHHPQRIEPNYEYSNPENEQLSDVVNVDGLWLCTRKAVWAKYKFDEATIREFHYYDMDFAMQIQQEFRVCVTYDILVEHKSLGTPNASWIRNAYIFDSKWGDKLPVMSRTISEKKRTEAEYIACKEFTLRLILYKFSNKEIAASLVKCFSLAPFNRDNLWLLKFWLTKQKALLN